MPLTIPHAATRAAVAAATNQTAQLAALIAAWAGGVVHVKSYQGATLRDTGIYATWVLDALTPRGMTLGALATRSISNGLLTIDRTDYCLADGTVIFSLDGADTPLAVALTATSHTNFADGVATKMRIVANSSLPLTAAPAWLVGAAVNEWVDIGASSQATATGAHFDAYGGLMLIDGTGALISSAQGGHQNSGNNVVASIDLLADAPAWQVQIAASSSIPALTENGTDYYPDGKTTSRHGYDHQHYISQRERAMLFGARIRYSLAGADGYTVDGHTVSGTWAWDAAGTYPSLSAGQGFGVAHDPTTGNVITNGARLWTQATNTWSVLAGFNGNWRWPVAYDSQRAQFFALQWGDGQGGAGPTYAQKFSPVTGAGTAITFNSIGGALAQFESDRPQYAGMGYDPINDCFLFYAGQTFNASGVLVSNVTQRVYKITPNAGATWDISLLPVTGVTPTACPADGSGINGRWKYVAALRGFVCVPTRGDNAFFLRTS